jgi:lysophospholipase L1-like esterase
MYLHASMRSMWRRSLLAGLLAVVAFIAAQQVMTAPEASAATPVRVMPLGDSITGSPGCWRAILWNRLQSSGLPSADFVGTLPPQGCGVAYDGDNEGHGGFLATSVADQNQLVGWLATTRPDIVMMHFGTNDVWSNRPNDVILAAFSKLVDQMRAGNPNMRILVAKIIPMGTSQCPECGQRVVSFNNAIPGWAASKTTSQSPITVVDQWTGFNTATDTYDGVHPNAAGDQKMSDKWYPALAAALGGVDPSGPPTPTVPTNGPPTTTPPTTGPPPGSGCAATYRSVGQWPGGFQGEVVVRNNGTAATRGWTVRMTFANGQQVNQMWGGSYTQSGSTVTVTNAGYNGAVGPNASVAFGFIASWNGGNTAPTLTCAAS